MSATDDAVRELSRALYLYPNYEVSSRGPSGCIMRAIKLLRPNVAEAIRELGADEAFQKCFGEDA